MAEHSQKQNIRITTRQSLITCLPCFSMLTSIESAELAMLFMEESFATGEVVVKEDDLIDKVYIIVDGLAEITRKKVHKARLRKSSKISYIPIGILSLGESIGLSDTGFFSQTGKRTATVTAVTKTLLLSLDIKKLHDFFQHHPQLLSDMNLVAEKMLRIRLIKQSLPFSHLSYDRLQWLADHIEVMTISAEKLIFSQGEIGDKCYLICQGEVEIFVKEDGQERRLTVLKAPTLFGEATLMTDTPRNASARALTDCELLMLQHHYLSELLETENNTAAMFMTLMVDRSRPIRHTAISEHPRITADQQEIVILKNPINGTYFKLSKEGWYIWQQLEGKKTLQEITMSLANHYNIFAPDLVAGLISKLAKSGFIQNLEVNDEKQLAKQAWWVRIMLHIRHFLEARKAIGNANQWVTYLYNKIGFLLFTQIGFISLLLLAISGVFAFAFSTPHIIQLFKSIHSTWFLFILLIPFTIVSVILHELGHAFATKYNGYEVQYMGVGWYWLGPVAFTDTSDMWLSTRWPRIMVNLAGIYSDIITAGISALLIMMISNTYIQCFLWLFSLYTYISAFRMLSPLQELDGYYILMDLFDRAHLRHSAVVWLMKDFDKALKKPQLFKNHAAEGFYWLACLLYLILITLITLLIQSFVLKILGIPSHHPLLSLVLPFLVAFFSSLTIIADIRSQEE